MTEMAEIVTRFSELVMHSILHSSPGLFEWVVNGEQARMLQTDKVGRSFTQHLQNLLSLLLVEFFKVWGLLVEQEN